MFCLFFSCRVSSSLLLKSSRNWGDGIRLRKEHARSCICLLSHTYRFLISSIFLFAFSERETGSVSGESVLRQYAYPGTIAITCKISTTAQKRVKDNIKYDTKALFLCVNRDFTIKSKEDRKHLISFIIIASNPFQGVMPCENFLLITS